jgi:hypothetical protein
MGQYELDASLTIVRQDDGSFVAYGNELPVFIVAKDMERLRKKIGLVSEAISAELDALGDEAFAEATLHELGIKVERIGDGGTISLPVLAGGRS